MTLHENDPNRPITDGPPTPPTRPSLPPHIIIDPSEKPPTPLAYKIIAIVIVVAMLSTLVFPALVMFSRRMPENCHRGPFGPTHCHTEPIDHAHSIFT